jgi:predicted nuclease of restriction endonuclease-like (RecB) superfamily
LKIADPQGRSFYEKQAAADNWSVRDLQRQKETALFLCRSDTDRRAC